MDTAMDLDDDDDWDSIFQMVETRLTQDDRVNTPPPLPSSLPAGQESSTEQNTIVPISTTFFPGANLDVYPPDLLVFSDDGVCFYVHRGKVLGVSDNYFASYLPYESDDLPVSIPLDSVVLNILFHVIYGMPVMHYRPSTDAVLDTIGLIRAYGLAIDVHLAPGTPLFDAAVSVASSAPIRFYSLAAGLDAHPLAVAVSSRLLSFPLDTLTDDVASKIGAVYLKRLFFLHLGRTAALKRLLAPPLKSHKPSLICDAREHRKLARAWSLASAYLVWDSKADVTPTAIETTIRSLAIHLTCSQCSAILRDRTADLVMEWSKIKLAEYIWRVN